MADKIGTYSVFSTDDGGEMTRLCGPMMTRAECRGFIERIKHATKMDVDVSSLRVYERVPGGYQEIILWINLVRNPAASSTFDSFEV